MESLPSYKEIKTRMPVVHSSRLFIEESRQTVRSILNGHDPRLLLIVGPCSIHERLAAKEFASLLRSLAQSVASQFFLVMRVYCEKPRTANGWKGFLYDPLLDGSHAMHLGIEWSRQLLLELAEMKIATATEFLDPLTAHYYDDLITWGSIGARTASSQTHRQLASGMQMPMAFKNGVAGDISAAVNGALAASLPHTYMRICENGSPMIARTAGNPDAHIVLRGGESGPNYDPSSVSESLVQLEKVKLPPRVLIDCSHQNSERKYDRQAAVYQSVIHQIVEGNTNIRGLMIESHLYAGTQHLTQDPGDLKYGVSITDACLDWTSTAHLIKWGAQHLHQDMLTRQPLTSCNDSAPFHHL